LPLDSQHSAEELLNGFSSSLKDGSLVPDCPCRQTQ